MEGQTRNHVSVPRYTHVCMWNDMCGAALLYRPQAYALCSNTTEHSEGMFILPVIAGLRKRWRNTRSILCASLTGDLCDIHSHTSVGLTLAPSTAPLSRSRCPQHELKLALWRATCIVFYQDTASVSLARVSPLPHMTVGGTSLFSWVTC